MGLHLQKQFVLDLCRPLEVLTVSKLHLFLMLGSEVVDPSVPGTHHVLLRVPRLACGWLEHIYLHVYTLYSRTTAQEALVLTSVKLHARRYMRHTV